MVSRGSGKEMKNCLIKAATTIGGLAMDFRKFFPVRMKKKKQTLTCLTRGYERGIVLL